MKENVPTPRFLDEERKLRILKLEPEAESAVRLGGGELLLGVGDGTRSITP